MEDNKEQKESSRYHKEIIGELENNKEKIDNIDDKVRKIHKRLVWISVSSYLKAVLILTPVIVGIIYLSPVVKKYFKALEPIFQILRLSPEDNTFNFDSLMNIFSKKGVDEEILAGICNPDIREEVINQVCQ